jgi:hypothetical protein
VGAGRAAGFPDPDADAGDDELREAAGGGEGGGEGRPHRDRDGEDVDAAEALGEARGGYAAQGIQGRESGAGEQAELRIGELQVHLHRLADDRNEAALRGVAGVDQHQQREHQAAVA